MARPFPGRQTRRRLLGHGRRATHSHCSGVDPSWRTTANRRVVVLSPLPEYALLASGRHAVQDRHVTHGLVVEPRPRAPPAQQKQRRCQTEFRQAYIWSTGHWSPSAFTNGYHGGFIKHSLMDLTEREELNTHNVKGPSTHILVLLRNLRAIFGTEITESSQAILPA